MPARFCPVCDIRMVPEYDHDAEVIIWHCSECGKTHIQGEYDDDD